MPERSLLPRRDPEPRPRTIGDVLIDAHGRELNRRGETAETYSLNRFVDDYARRMDEEGRQQEAKAIRDWRTQNQAAGLQEADTTRRLAESDAELGGGTLLDLGVRNLLGLKRTREELIEDNAGPNVGRDVARMILAGADQYGRMGGEFIAGATDLASKPLEAVGGPSLRINPYRDMAEGLLEEQGKRGFVNVIPGMGGDEALGSIDENLTSGKHPSGMAIWKRPEETAGDVLQRGLGSMEEADMVRGVKPWMYQASRIAGSLFAFRDLGGIVNRWGNVMKLSPVAARGANVLGRVLQNGTVSFAAMEGLMGWGAAADAEARGQPELADQLRGSVLPRMANAAVLSVMLKPLAFLGRGLERSILKATGNPAVAGTLGQALKDLPKWYQRMVATGAHGVNKAVELAGFGFIPEVYHFNHDGSTELSPWITTILNPQKIGEVLMGKAGADEWYNAVADVLTHAWEELPAQLAAGGLVGVASARGATVGGKPGARDLNPFTIGPRQITEPIGRVTSRVRHPDAAGMGQAERMHDAAREVSVRARRKITPQQRRLIKEAMPAIERDQVERLADRPGTIAAIVNYVATAAEIQHQIWRQRGYLPRDAETFHQRLSAWMEENLGPEVLKGPAKTDKPGLGIQVAFVNDPAAPGQPVGREGEIIETFEARPPVLADLTGQVTPAGQAAEAIQMARVRWADGTEGLVPLNRLVPAAVTPQHVEPGQEGGRELASRPTEPTRRPGQPGVMQGDGRGTPTADAGKRGDLGVVDRRPQQGPEDLFTGRGEGLDPGEPALLLRGWITPDGVRMYDVEYRDGQVRSVPADQFGPPQAVEGPEGPRVQLLPAGRPQLPAGEVPPGAPERPAEGPPAAPSGTPKEAPNAREGAGGAAQPPAGPTPRPTRARQTWEEVRSDLELMALNLKKETAGLDADGPRDARFHVNEVARRLIEAWRGLKAEAGEGREGGVDAANLPQAFELFEQAMADFAASLPAGTAESARSGRTQDPARGLRETFPGGKAGNPYAALERAARAALSAHMDRAQANEAAAEGFRSSPLQQHFENLHTLLRDFGVEPPYGADLEHPFRELHVGLAREWLIKNGPPGGKKGAPPPAETPIDAMARVLAEHGIRLEKASYDKETGTTLLRIKDTHLFEPGEVLPGTGLKILEVNYPRTKDFRTGGEGRITQVRLDGKWDPRKPAEPPSQEPTTPQRRASDKGPAIRGRRRVDLEDAPGDSPEVRRLKRHARREREAKERAKRQALTDPMTELASRRVIEKARARVDRDPANGWVEVDLVGLSEANAALGEAGADRVIQEGARIFRERAAELGLSAGRRGGDELIAWDGTAEQRAELARAMEDGFRFEGKDYRFRAAQADTWDGLKEAMRAAKERIPSGRKPKEGEEPPPLPAAEEAPKPPADLAAMDKAADVAALAGLWHDYAAEAQSAKGKKARAAAEKERDRIGRQLEERLKGMDPELRRLVDGLLGDLEVDLPPGMGGGRKPRGALPDREEKPPPLPPAEEGETPPPLPADRAPLPTRAPPTGLADRIGVARKQAAQGKISFGEIDRFVNEDIGKGSREDIVAAANAADIPMAPSTSKKEALRIIREFLRGGREAWSRANFDGDRPPPQERAGGGKKPRQPEATGVPRVPTPTTPETRRHRLDHGEPDRTIPTQKSPTYGEVVDSAFMKELLSGSRWKSRRHPAEGKVELDEILRAFNTHRDLGKLEEALGRWARKRIRKGYEETEVAEILRRLDQRAQRKVVEAAADRLTDDQLVDAILERALEERPGYPREPSVTKARERRRMEIEALDLIAKERGIDTRPPKDPEVLVEVKTWGRGATQEHRVREKDGAWEVVHRDTEGPDLDWRVTSGGHESKDAAIQALAESMRHSEDRIVEAKPEFRKRIEKAKADAEEAREREKAEKEAEQEAAQKARLEELDKLAKLKKAVEKLWGKTHKTGKGRITIPVASEEKPVVWAAKLVKGTPWAINRSYGMKKGWSVTHAADGRAIIGGLPTQQHAQELVLRIGQLPHAYDFEKAETFAKKNPEAWAALQKLTREWRDGRFIWEEVENPDKTKSKVIVGEKYLEFPGIELDPAPLAVKPDAEGRITLTGTHLKDLEMGADLAVRPHGTDATFNNATLTEVTDQRAGGFDLTKDDPTAMGGYRLGGGYSKGSEAGGYTDKPLEWVKAFATANPVFAQNPAFKVGPAKSEGKGPMADLDWPIALSWEGGGARYYIRPEALGLTEGFLDGVKSVRIDLKGILTKAQIGRAQMENEGLAGLPGALDLDPKDLTLDPYFFRVERTEKGEPLPHELPGMLSPEERVSQARTSDPVQTWAKAVGGIEVPVSDLPTQTWSGKRTGKTRLVNAIADLFNVPIQFGRYAPFRQGMVLGWWSERMGLVRLARPGMFEAAAHEGGHSMERKLFPIMRKAGSWADMEKELRRLGYELYGDPEPWNGYVSEGLAEFFRLYITQPEHLATWAPQTVAWFDANMMKGNRRWHRRLQKVRQMAQDWREQGYENRIMGEVTPHRAVQKNVEKILGHFGQSDWIDVLHPLQVLSMAAAKSRGAPLPPELDPYFVADALRGTSHARARTMVEDVMIDPASNAQGEPLSRAKQIARAFAKKAGWSAEQADDKLTAYMIAKRTLALPKGRRPKNVKLSDARNMVKEVETRYPELERAAEMVWEWNKGLLAYVHQLGAISTSDYRTLLKKSLFYIPFHRDVPTAVADRRAIGGAGAKSPLKRIGGSAREFKDPWVAMAAQAEGLISFAHRRAVLHRLALAANTTSGLGQFINPVHRDVLKKVQPLRKFREFLEDNLGISFGTIAKQTGVDPNTLLLEWYEPKPMPDTRDPIIPIVDARGRTRWYQVNREIYDSLSGMDVYRLPGALDLFLGVPARFKRLGTTGLRASFSLVTNPLRDFFTGLIQSQEANPVKWAGAWAKSQAEAVPALFGKRSPYYELYDRLGVRMATVIGQDSAVTHRLGRHMGRGRGARIVHDVKKGRLIQGFEDLVDGVRDVFQIPEAGPRVAEIRRMLDRWKKSGAWKEGQPLTFGQSLELLRAGKRVTVDFSAAGRYARVLNQAIPFFNVAIQGPRHFARAYKEHPLRTTLAGMTVTALTLALWNQVKDEDWWKDLPWWRKFNFWHIPIDEHTRIEIPRPFEPGILFAVMPEAIIDSMYREDPETVMQALGHSWNQIRPDLMPVIPQEVGEQLANRDWFTDRPIVPRGLEGRPDEEQHTPYTSGAAKGLGKLMGWSPLRIDHAIRGIFGGLGADVARTTTGPGLLRADRERELADLPVAGRLFPSGGIQGSQSQAVTDLFDLREELQTRAASEENPATPQERVALRLLERGAQDLRRLREKRNEAYDQATARDLHVQMREAALRSLERARAILDGPSRSSRTPAPSGGQRSLLPSR